MENQYNNNAWRRKNMKRVFSITGLVVLLVALCQEPLADEAKEEAATQASDAWLSLVDDGQYAESWRLAADYLRNAVGKEQWEYQMTAFREPLGRVLSRKLISRTYTRSLPGAPDGDYVVIQYASSFEKKASATETVTPMLDQDAQWRVSGYYIK
jgi:hypothetical protein